MRCLCYAPTLIAIIYLVSLEVLFAQDGLEAAELDIYLAGGAFRLTEENIFILQDVQVCLVIYIHTF